jgi:hypothetical protein
MNVAIVVHLLLLPLLVLLAINSLRRIWMIRSHWQADPPQDRWKRLVTVGRVVYHVALILLYVWAILLMVRAWTAGTQA